MSDHIPVLTLGKMMDGVDDALNGRFELFSDLDAAVDDIVAARGSEIRAIATRGKTAVDGALMDRLPKLEIVATFAVGYDSVDAVAAEQRGVMVTNTPDVLNDEVADLTVGLTLATIRQIPQADRYLRAGEWAKATFPLTASLRDRTIGIAGMGRIGQAIASRFEPFGRPIVYHSRRPVAGVAYRHYPDMVSLAENCDVLIVILPGGPATKHIVNEAVLKALGPNGVLINVARGSVVDEARLVEALKAGEILAAGLDVFEKEPGFTPELAELDNVVLQPHVGSGTHFTRGLMADLGVRNLNAWFDGAGPVTPVSETPWPRG